MGLEVELEALEVLDAQQRRPFRLGGRAAPPQRVEQRARDVEVERIAELERPRLVGPQPDRAARVDFVPAGAILVQRAIDLGQRLRPDPPDRARRQLGSVAAVREIARAPQRGLQVAQDQDRVARLLGEQLAQLLRRDLLEVSLGQVAGELLDRLQTLADALGRLVVGALSEPRKRPPSLLQEALERAQPLQLVQQLAVVLARLLVLEAMLAEALDRVREVWRLGVAPGEEVVHPARFEAVPLAQRRLLAVQDLVQPLPQLLGGGVHPVALAQLAGFARELLAGAPRPPSPGSSVPPSSKPNWRIQSSASRAESPCSSSSESASSACFGSSENGCCVRVPTAVDARPHDRV